MEQLILYKENRIVNFFYNYNYNYVIYFFMYSFLLRCFYDLMDVILNCISKKYTELSKYKQLYITKNLLKSVSLFLLSIYSFQYLLIPIMYNGKWNNDIIHQAAILYTMNDFVGLLTIPGLPKTTVRHHQITTVLCMCSFGIDFQNSELGKMLFIYTLASSYAYLVNFYLAIRYLIPKKNLEMVRLSARNIYFICCALNWGWHGKWILNHYDVLYIQHFIYFFLLRWIIKDDLILLSWLGRSHTLLQSSTTRSSKSSI